MLPSKDEIVKQVKLTIEQKDWSKQAIKVLNKSSAAVLDRVQQNIGVQLQEDTAPIVENFVVNLSRTLMDATVDFLNKKENAANSLPVFPVGTRYIKQSGDILTVVIEQQPQVRTLSFTIDSAGAFDGDYKRHRNTYHVGLPYTVFVLTFIGGHWESLQTFWRSRPLNALSDELALAGLPNISGAGSVCMGTFRPAAGTINNQCEQAISSFWQSDFGADHVERIKKFLNLNGMTIKQWVEKSHENPLVGTTFKLSPANVKLQEVLSTDANYNLVAQLKQHILTAVGQIGGEIQKLMVDLDITGENKDKVHVETMSSVIKEIIVQAYAELWDQLSLKLDQERKADAVKNQEIREKMKSEFMNWVRDYYPQLSRKSFWE